MHKWTRNHTYWSLNKNEARHLKRCSKFVRGYSVLHSMLRNLMSSFINIISLYNPFNFFAILYPTSLANLVVEVGTRHSHQFLVADCSRPISQIPQCIRKKYPTMHRFITKMCTNAHISVTIWCIVGIGLVHCGICAMGLMGSRLYTSVQCPQKKLTNTTRNPWQASKSKVDIWRTKDSDCKLLKY